ncbi:helix-turn-helix domain-containing protein [Kribbella sp. NPDC050124]|uniref:helix-turn-helix domain-containing protein n=1 Tax=Kribbella sp. NPDC050124 TaxID=3364114 RepID=UPI0037BCEB72
MRLVAEFTTEPFDVEGQPPAHATKALEAAREAGLECDFGPLGTSVRGEEELLLPAVSRVLEAAFANGASQVSLQVRQDGAVRTPREGSGVNALLAEVAAELGGSLSGLSRGDKQRAVLLLEAKGAFEYRKSAETVAEALGVTRFTVYNYLNRARD